MFLIWAKKKEPEKRKGQKGRGRSLLGEKGMGKVTKADAAEEKS